MAPSYRDVAVWLFKKADRDDDEPVEHDVPQRRLVQRGGRVCEVTTPPARETR